MPKKRGNRKSQTISTDFIVGFTLYFLAFAIFSYFVFGVEGGLFTERSFLKDTYYSFDVFEENVRNSGLDIGSSYHLTGEIEELKGFNYTELMVVALNGTQFENMMGAIDVCVYLTDKTERTYFHAGPASGNLTLGEVIPCGENTPIPVGVPPFPDCGEVYEEGFSATKLYFYEETNRTAKLIIHFCKK